MTSFDIISDLHLSSEDEFSWEGKATSLFCIVAGNISSDLDVVQQVLTYLSTFYQGVFYIDGNVEHDIVENKEKRISELTKIIRKINKTVYLHDNVIIVNGVALVAINGWYGNTNVLLPFDDLRIAAYRTEDMAYLQSTIKKLQLHLEVSNILVISNCVPDKNLFFGEDEHITDTMSPSICLMSDTEKKVKHWVFGGDKMADAILNGIRFVSNPCDTSMPYWAKRIEID